MPDVFHCLKGIQKSVREKREIEELAQGDYLLVGMEGQPVLDGVQDIPPTQQLYLFDLGQNGLQGTNVPVRVEGIQEVLMQNESLFSESEEYGKQEEILKRCLEEGETTFLEIRQALTRQKLMTESVQALSRYLQKLIQISMTNIINYSDSLDVFSEKCKQALHKDLRNKQSNIVQVKGFIDQDKLANAKKQALSALHAAKNCTAKEELQRLNLAFEKKRGEKNYGDVLKDRSKEHANSLRNLSELLKARKAKVQEFSEMRQSLSSSSNVKSSIGSAQYYNFMKINDKDYGQQAAFLSSSIFGQELTTLAIIPELLDIVKKINELGIDDLLKAQKEGFQHLDFVLYCKNLPMAYDNCKKEVERRQGFKQQFKQEIFHWNENIKKVAKEENVKRESFLKKQEIFLSQPLPQNLILGIYDKVKVPEFKLDLDPNLPTREQLNEAQDLDEWESVSFYNFLKGNDILEFSRSNNLISPAPTPEQSPAATSQTTVLQEALTSAMEQIEELKKSQIQPSSSSNTEEVEKLKKLLREKDDRLNHLLKEKDEKFNILLKEKDEKLNNLLKEKDDRIAARLADANTIRESLEARVKFLEEEASQQQKIQADSSEQISVVREEFAVRMDAMKAEHDDLNKQNHELKHKQSALLKEKDSLASALQKLQTDLNLLQAENNRISLASENQAKTQSSEVDKFKRTIVQLEEEKKFALEQVKEMKLLLSEGDARNGKFLSDISSMNKQLVESKMRVADLQTLLDQKTRDEEMKEKETSEMSEKIATLTTMINEKENQLIAQLKRFEQGEHKAEGMADALRSVSSEVKTLKNELRIKSVAENKLKEKVLNTENKLKSLQTEIQTKSKSEHMLLDQLSSLKTHLKKKETEGDVLLKVKEEIEDLNQRLKEKDRKIDQSNAQLVHMQQQCKILTESEQSHAKKIEAYSEELRAMKKYVERLEKEKAEIMKQVKLEKAKQASTDKIMKLEQRVAQLEKALNSSRSEIQHAQTMSSARESIIENLKDKIKKQTTLLLQLHRQQKAEPSLDSLMQAWAVYRQQLTQLNQQTIFTNSMEALGMVSTRILHLLTMLNDIGTFMSNLHGSKNCQEIAKVLHMLCTEGKTCGELLDATRSELLLQQRYPSGHHM